MLILTSYELSTGSGTDPEISFWLKCVTNINIYVRKEHTGWKTLSHSKQQPN